MRAGLVTLTDANTNYNLKTLLEALTDWVPTAGVVPMKVREILIMADPSNAAGIVLLGDDKLSATRYGWSLIAEASVPFRSYGNNIYVGDYYARSATAGMKLGITLEWQ